MGDTDYLERRNFFRVDDEVIISVKPITPEEKVEGIARLKTQALELMDVSRLYMSLESSLQEHLRNIKDVNLKSALELFNRKLNLLANKELVKEPYQSIMSKPSETVSLSASGVGLYTDKPWHLGEDCTLELILLPSKVYLFSYGKIVSSAKAERPSAHQSLEQQELFRVGVNFDFMREEDMERLIQHIMRVEAQLIRKARV